MDHTAENEHYDVMIDDPVLTKHGFTKFSLPLNGKATRMVVHNTVKSKMMYPTFYESDLGKTVESLRDKIISDRVLIDNYTADGLVAYFRNAGILLSEDEDSPFFKNGHGNGNAFSIKGQGQEEERKSAAQKVLDLIDQHCHEVFTDQFGTPYAAVKIREHIETLPLKDSRFRNWLCRIYYISEGNVLNSETVSNVLNILNAKAEFEGNARTLSLRVASVQEEPFTIYYDLANKEWQVVKITPTGWSIEKSPIIFRRHKSQQPQVYPSKGYSPDVFDRFMDLMNIKGKDETLLEKGYIVSLFYPDIPKPISVVMAEHGSAKTTEHELQKKLVDPSGTETLTFPRKINELVQKLSHNYVAYFDNVSKLPDWVSDQLCRAATGSGFSKRELYTDDEDIIYNFIRCTGINGINIAGLKQDLLDRAILRKRERIPKDKRRTKIDVHAEFDRLRPQLLGYIFDVLVNVLKVKSQGGIKLKELPRMADFAEIAEIACRCMGYKDNNEFLKAYDKNIELQVEEALAANLISNAIIKLMESKAEWMGTASQLLTDLEQAATEIKINLNSKGWPKGANVLSGRLDEVKTNLREIGIVIDKEAAKDPKTRVKTILIQNVKLCKQSLESFESPEDKNRAQIASDNSNDQNKTKRYDRSQAEGSFAENEQNRVQNSGSNDANDANDTLHTLHGQSVDDTSTYNNNIEEWWQNEQKKIKPPDPSLFAFSGYRCYYCNFETEGCGKGSKNRYEKHVRDIHGADSDHPCYPTKAELERLGLKPQGKRWEI
jgi:hypothetical protein